MTLARLAFVIALALALLTIAAYRDAPFNNFIDLDDPDYASANPNVRDGLTPAGFVWALTTFHAANWHPLTWLSLQLDASLLGPGPVGYHLTNLLLHTANVVLLFLVLRRMTGALWRSALVAALFAVHPLHVESVAWVAERKDVLSTFFWVVTLAAYAHYAARPSPGRYLLVMALFVLGLLAKPMLVTLPCVLLLLDYWPLRRLAGRQQPAGYAQAPASRLVLEKVPLLLASALACVLTLAAQAGAGAVSGMQQVSLPQRIGNALLAYEWYLGKTFWPVGLGLLYPYPTTVSLVEVLGAGAVLTAVTVLAVWQVRRRPYLLVGWLWFLGTLVPVLGIVQVGEQAHADRYAYVPHIGLFFAFVWGLADLCAGLRVPVAVRAGLAGVVLLALAVLTFEQVGYWQDGISLWEHTLTVTGPNPRAHDSLGTLYLYQDNFTEARRHAEEAIRLDPRNSRSHFNLGVIFEEKDADLDRAEEEFRTVLRLAPTLHAVTYDLNRYAHYHLAQVLEKQGRREEAQRHYQAARAGT
jgi:protein O-mannosyl-transferase